MPSNNHRDTSKDVRLDVDNFINGIPGSVYWKDINGVYLGCNNTVLLKGNMSSKSEIIGKTDQEVWPEMAESLRKIDLEVMRLNKTIEVEETVVLKGGELLHFSSVKSPLLDEEGHIVGVIGNSLDITELKQEKQNAEAASQAKTQFLALMSHELRTPLTGIISTASMLVEAEEMQLKPNEIRDFAKIIEQSGAYLLSTIDNILDFAKLEANKFDLINAPFKLDNLIEDINNTLISSAHKKNIELTVEYEPDLPPKLISDTRILRHIMTNLIGNAIKYTDKGYIKVRVKTEIRNPEIAQISISVSDSGIGIPHDKLEFIFDKFAQVENGYTHKSSRLGTGLGLSIVKKLMNLLNGHIDVTSEIGKGSTFTLSLEFPIQNISQKLAWDAYSATIKLLIVSDKASSEVICKHSGATYCDIIDGENAIDTMLTAQQVSQAYDIVIFDNDLSQPSAAELVKTLSKRKLQKEPLLILLSSLKSSQDKMHASEQGFFATISKPIRPVAFQNDLASIWEKWSEMKNPHKEIKDE